jgi:multiple sugar transport system permease protein
VRKLALPFLLGVVLLVVAPLLMTVVLAFTEYDALSPPRMVSWANFDRMFGDPLFWSSLRSSILLAVIAVPLRLLLALCLALLLAAPGKGVRAARTAAYLPSVVPESAYALLWLCLLNPLYGPFGLMLQSLGVGGDLLLTPWGAQLSIAAMLVFQIGEIYVVLLAARRELPAELYELCAMEGASRLFVFRRLTLPMLAPTLLFLAARDAAWSLQASFVPSLIVTHGGPRYATTYLSLYAYQNAFEYLRLGYASALTLAMLVITALMVAATVLLAAPRES